jgi:hypothetical protein
MESIMFEGMQELDSNELMTVNGGNAWEFVKDFWKVAPEPLKFTVALFAEASLVFEGGRQLGEYIADVYYWAVQ